MNVHDLIAISREPNVAAFLRVVRAGESGQSDTAYRTLYGGQLFDELAAHPRRAIRSPWGWTSAAGAYQIVAVVEGRCKVDTEDWLVRTHGFTDFSPEQQDGRAVALIIRRGALAAIRAGGIDEAIALCAKEWASLPGSPYGQPTRTLEQCRAVYAAWGGALGPQPAQTSPELVPEPAAPVREVSTVELVTSWWAALRAGAKLANSATWKDRQNVTNTLATLLGAGVVIARARGYEIPLSDADLVLVAGGVAALLGVLNTALTTATTGSVGLPPAAGRDTGGGP